MKKLMRLLACAMCILTLFFMTENVVTAAKDTLIIAHKQDMVDKNPAGNTTNATIKIKAQVYETLIERNTDTNEYLPLLAESWEWSDDYMALTVKLKKGVSDTQR